MFDRLTVLVMLVGGCGGGTDSPDAAFPSDYQASYVEVRPCRTSVEHDLNNVVIYADPTSADTYLMRNGPFAPDSVVLKEEYDIADQTCSGPIVQWTVMVKLPDASSPETIDWHWQKVDQKRKVITTDEPRCISCHQDCGGSPDGFGGTCSPP